MSTPPPPTDTDDPRTTAAAPTTSRPRAQRRGGRRPFADKRWYVDSQGRRYWSVTTLLKALPKDALPGWAARKTATAAIDNLDMWASYLDRMGRDAAIRALADARWSSNKEAIDRGTVVHAAIHRWLLDAPLPAGMNSSEERCVVQFLDFLARHRPEVYATETTVFNHQQWYAGTLDMILRLPIVPGAPLALIDVKTGSGVYPEASLQLTAYRHATFFEVGDGREHPMPDVDACFVLHLAVDPEGDGTDDRWDLVPVETLTVQETTGHERSLFSTFLYTREQYRFLNELAVNVIGAPLPVPPLTGEPTAPTMLELIAPPDPTADAPEGDD